MKNRGGLFTGWRQVFNFTAEQNMKGAGFKASTIGISILIFALFFAINCIMANSQLEDSRKDPDAAIDIEDTTINTIYYVCEDEYSKQVVDTTLAAIGEQLEIEFKKASGDNATDTHTNEQGSIVMVASTEEYVMKFDFNVSKESNVDKGDVEEFALQFVSVVDNIKYSIAGLSEIQIAILNSSEYVYSEVISVDELDEEIDEGLMIAEMVVPMVYTMLFYFIILMYAQSIQKLVVAEKTSKLMETLLASVKPYAVITGKVLAMATIGIGQTVLWIVSGVLGYIVGDKVALEIYPEYENYIGGIIELMKTDSEIAFAPTGIVLAIICMILGYLVYCILSGLSGALVNKIEDMSSYQMIFMIPVMIGFFASYMGPLFSDNEVMFTIFRIIPIISPFMIPAELIIGKAAMWEGIASIAVSLITCAALVMFTGKVYKDKVFNR